MAKLDDKLLVKKIILEKPYMTNASVKTIEEALGDLPPPLDENLKEWIAGKALTDHLIHGKYSVNTVLKIRNSKDVISALIDLAQYAKNKESEFILWQTRM